MVRGLVEALEDLSLADVPVEQVHLAQQGAVVRLHLFVLGEVHRLVAEMMESGVNQLRRLGDGPISGTAATAVQQTLLDDWEKFISKYTELIARGMWIGVGLPLGTLAILHSAYILPNLELNESQRQFTEQINSDVVFQPQLQAVIDAAYQRVYDDGLNLSQRIWQLDTYGRNGLNSAVSLAIGQGKSAWELAQSIEGFLGPGQDCPRWTRDRLNGLTKADIASGDRTGLHSGNECQAQGVSYNALRLARTEIQDDLVRCTRIDHSR